MSDETDEWPPADVAALNRLRRKFNRFADAEYVDLRDVSLSFRDRVALCVLSAGLAASAAHAASVAVPGSSLLHVALWMAVGFAVAAAAARIAVAALGGEPA